MIDVIDCQLFNTRTHVNLLKKNSYCFTALKVPTFSRQHSFFFKNVKYWPFFGWDALIFDRSTHPKSVC